MVQKWSIKFQNVTFITFIGNDLRSIPAKFEFDAIKTVGAVDFKKNSYAYTYIRTFTQTTTQLKKCLHYTSL